MGLLIIELIVVCDIWKEIFGVILSLFYFWFLIKFLSMCNDVCVINIEDE